MEVFRALADGDYRSRDALHTGSKFSVDEMMIRFGGRSSHTARLKNKPIKEGYKILVVCDSGVTLDVLRIATPDVSHQFPGLRARNPAAGISLQCVVSTFETLQCSYT
jgi:hypothetical protein